MLIYRINGGGVHQVKFIWLSKPVKTFSGESIVSKHHLNALLLELFKILGNKSSASVDFEDKNGNWGHAIIVPRVKHQDSFQKQAKKLKWIESLLDHVAGSNQHNENDAAKWMSCYIGKKYNGPFTLALEALGLPVVQRLDEKSTAAMWADAIINYTQQRIIKKHPQLHFWKWLFITDTTFNEDHEHYCIPTLYNEYKHYEKGDRTQKPERCQFWCRDPSLVVSTELSRLLDYLDPNLITTRFSSLLASGFCTLIAGADQGQGAWWSWIKISTMSGEEVWSQMSIEEIFDTKSSYIIAQVAHITCKKDHHEILSATVSDRLPVGYEKLQSHIILFVKLSTCSIKVKAVMISKNAIGIKLECDSMDPTVCYLTYQTSGSSFNHDPSRWNKVSCRFKNNIYYATLLPFYYQQFKLLCWRARNAYNSSSYWCPRCLLSYADWNWSPETFNVEERTFELLTEVSLAVKNDSERKLKPVYWKGVTCEKHYKCLGPKTFVPPLLHLEIGMVNQALDTFEDWMDDAVEIIPSHEKEARREVLDTKERLAIALDNKKEADATINIKIREKSGEAVSIKAQLWKKGSKNSRHDELKVQLTLLETFINEQRNQIKKFKEEIKKIQ